MATFFSLHANFVLDTGITLMRRIMRGERWYEAHNEHFYQRLIRAGKSHTQVTLTEGCTPTWGYFAASWFPELFNTEKQIFIGLLIIGILGCYFSFMPRGCIQSSLLH